MKTSGCFQQFDLVLKATVKPCDTADPIGAIRRQLNSLLFTYDDYIEGVPLSYGSLNLPRGQEYGRFIADQYWVHVDVSASVLAFKPTRGKFIEGRVISVARSGLSLLVLSLFNASISDRLLERASFKYDGESSSW